VSEVLNAMTCDMGSDSRVNWAMRLCLTALGELRGLPAERSRLKLSAAPMSPARPVISSPILEKHSPVLPPTSAVS